MRLLFALVASVKTFERGRQLHMHCPRLFSSRNDGRVYGTILPFVYASNAIFIPLWLVVFFHRTNSGMRWTDSMGCWHGRKHVMFKLAKDCLMLRDYKLHDEFFCKRRCNLCQSDQHNHSHVDMYCIKRFWNCELHNWRVCRRGNNYTRSCYHVRNDKFIV